ncbi:hypothetical protein PV08_01393 [Exophiala spinifera]|uniref:Uncharacterized protein n=1 Tax=Exophiala spinifera TaxID=91928 RepID=A0A0D2BQR4_9EURO|nr:uncharacterized protein PV08_01393 [Exophiala spinifera]KIW20815.1 hypothetical protein PV08_01393 [Exophiala spinifera]
MSNPQTVVHVCSTTESALSEIPGLLRGEKVMASSGQGTNATAQTPFRADISLVIVGAFSPPDAQAITNAVTATTTPASVAVFVADTTKKSPGQQGPPTIEMIQARILESINAAEKSDGTFGPGVYRF